MTNVTPPLQLIQKKQNQNQKHTSRSHQIGSLKVCWLEAASTWWFSNPGQADRNGRLKFIYNLSIVHKSRFEEYEYDLFSSLDRREEGPISYLSNHHGFQKIIPEFNRVFRKVISRIRNLLILRQDSNQLNYRLGNHDKMYLRCS